MSCDQDSCVTQPQLVAYRSPHHSGPITVSGEHLAVYDSHIDHTYFTAPTRESPSTYRHTHVGEHITTYMYMYVYVFSGTSRLMDTLGWTIIERLSSFGGEMYCHYMYVG